MEIQKVCKPFSDLTPQELYGIIRLRAEVFVVEQKCIFQDLDNKDQRSHHFMLFNNNTLVAYSRLLPFGFSYADATSIGRVVTHQSIRGTGIGKRLMEESIALCTTLYGQHKIKIGAQLYAKKFYESVGFEQSGDIYLEDDIEHIEMTRDEYGN